MNRKCTLCGTIKNVAIFRTGRNQCKPCLAIAKKKWDLENKDHIAEYKRNNPRTQTESDIRYKRAFYVKNKQRLLAADKAWAKNNPEAISIHKKRWRDKNVSRINSYTANYRANKKYATPQWADQSAIRSIYAFSTFLTKTTFGNGYHVDHIIPLNSDIVCGLHTQENLQVLRATDNMNKGNRPWPDMPDIDSEAESVEILNV